MVQILSLKNVVSRTSFGATRWGMVRVLCAFAMALATSSAMAQVSTRSGAEPAMVSHDAHIWVNHDGSFDVSEISVVNAASPHEFHRDLAFPGRKLEPRDVFLMGASENDVTVNAELMPVGDGMRIEVHPTRRIGPRKFEIDYRIRYGEVDHGKLDWPLISASNQLPLQHASLRVTLPEETPSSQIHAQFQLDGADVGEGEIHVTENRVSLDWPGGVAPGQALGAVITFPRFTSSRQFDPPKGPAWMFNGPLWLAVLALYYVAAKLLFTGGGEGKPVIVEYEAPPGWSAAAVRLLWHGSWDHRCFATGVLGIAAKGGLTLGKQPDGSWVATHAGNDYMPVLTADERALRRALFTFGRSAHFSGAKADTTGLAELAFRRELEARCSQEQPIDPAMLLIPGWLISLSAATLLFFGTDNRWAMVGQIFVPSLVGALALAIFFGKVPRGVLRAIRGQAFFVAAICVAGLFGGAERVDWLAGAALLIGQVVASWWLPRQPPSDTPLLRKLRGFRWYLGTAEQSEMDARYKPSLHPELQASLLPYAMALDVEVSWNARFAASLAGAERQADFIAFLNPEHDQAALDLLAFAQSMAQRSQANRDGMGSGTL